MNMSGIIQNADELEFAVFCVENVARSLGIDGRRAYEVLTEKSDILNNYIVPCYDVLHTQGKDYIVKDIIEYMEKEGVAL